MDNENGINQPAQPDVNPVSSPDGQEGNTAPPASKPGVQTPPPAQETVPFDKHPRWQQLQRERKSERQELENLKRQYAEQKGYLDAMRYQGQQKGQLTPEQQEQQRQLEYLVEMLANPLKEKLGLSKYDKLETQFNELSNSWQSSQAESEMNQVLSKVKDLGLDPEEVRSEIEEAIGNHPMYAETTYRNGAIRAVFRDLYWDRRGELAERAVNQETIKKKEALRRGQTQTPSAAGTRPGSIKPDDLLKEAGGVGGIDFTR